MGPPSGGLPIHRYDGGKGIFDWGFQIGRDDPSGCTRPAIQAGGEADMAFPDMTRDPVRMVSRDVENVDR